MHQPISSALTSRFVLISSAFSLISLHRRLILYTCHFIIFVLVAFTSIIFSLIQFRRKTQPVAFLFHLPSQHGLLLCMRSLATTYGLHTVAWTFSSPSPFLHPSVALSVCPVCLSVTLVYCDQTVERIKMKLGMEVGIGPATLC